MKKAYVSPNYEFVVFSDCDVVRTSGCEIVDCPGYSCTSDGASVCTEDWNTCDNKQ